MSYTDDYAGNTSTAGTVTVGGSATGSIELVNDKDWFKAYLNAGSVYMLYLDGAASGGGTLGAGSDTPYLTLYSSTGSYLGATYNGSASGDPAMSYTPTSSGYYYLAAGELGDDAIGTYRVRIESGVADDYAGNTSTAGTVTVGGSATGSIELVNDKDWFKAYLNAGSVYMLYLDGAASGGGTLGAGSDTPYLTLYSSTGSYLGATYNGSASGDPAMSYTPTSSGYYYLAAGELGDDAIGTYRVRIDNGTGLTDTMPPIVASLSPVNGATGVVIAENIIVTFSEAISRGTGSVVLKTAAGITVATYNAATSSNLSISGSTLTINPTADLAYSTGYKVEFAAGSIKDIAGNSYAGTSSYNFTTAAAPDTTAPSVTTFSPADEATGIAIGSNIVVTFNEAISRGTGSIVLKTAAGITVATYDAATSGNLTISGSTLTINPSSDLANSKGYKVEFATGTIKDVAGNNYAGTTSYNFTTVAQSGSNQTGTSGNDTMTGGASNDTLDGGAGTDTVDYSGNRSSYEVIKTASGYTVSGGSDGTDTLTNIERIQFSDMTVNLTIQDIAAAAPEADVQRIEELYVAFFNRVPDADGLAYWIGQMSAGQSINQIAEAFYNAGIQYSSLTGFSSGMSNADFVNVVYSNVLGRSEGADTGGLTYWSGKLANGQATHGSLVSTILGSAHTYKGDATWGWVADLLDNKITVANQFAVDWGLNYNTPSESITQGMAIAAAVTPTSTAAAIALIGVSATDMQIA